MGIHCSTSNPDYSQNTGQTLTQHTQRTYTENSINIMKLLATAKFILWVLHVTVLTGWYMPPAAKKNRKEGMTSTLPRQQAGKHSDWPKHCCIVMNSSLLLLLPNHTDYYGKVFSKCCSIYITLAAEAHTYSGELSGCSWRSGHSLGHHCTSLDTGNRKKAEWVVCVLVSSVVSS